MQILSYRELFSTSSDSSVCGFWWEICLSKVFKFQFYKYWMSQFDFTLVEATEYPWMKISIPRNCENSKKCSKILELKRVMANKDIDWNAWGFECTFVIKQDQVLFDTYLISRSQYKYVWAKMQSS